MDPPQVPWSCGASEASSLLREFVKERSELLSHFVSPALGDPSMATWQIFNIGHRADYNSLNGFGQHSSTVSPFMFGQPADRQNMCLTLSKASPTVSALLNESKNWLKNNNSFGASSPSNFASLPISGPVQQVVSYRLGDPAESLRILTNQGKDTAQYSSVLLDHQPPILDEQRNTTTASINPCQASSAPAKLMTTASASSSKSKVRLLRATAAAATSISKTKQVKRPKNGRPKRALTAYNLFFKDQREQILADLRQQGDPDNARHESSTDRVSIGFEEMGKRIAVKWKMLDSSMRRSYETRAKAEKQKYNAELADYMQNARNEREAKLASLQASVSEETKERYFAKRK